MLENRGVVLLQLWIKAVCSDLLQNYFVHHCLRIVNVIDSHSSDNVSFASQISNEALHAFDKQEFVKRALFLNHLDIFLLKLKEINVAW